MTVEQTIAIKAIVITVCILWAASKLSPMFWRWWRS